MQSVAHGMIEILTPVRTFLRSGLTVLQKESPHFREGRKSTDDGLQDMLTIAEEWFEENPNGLQEIWDNLDIA